MDHPAETDNRFTFFSHYWGRKFSAKSCAVHMHILLIAGLNFIIHTRMHVMLITWSK